MILFLRNKRRQTIVDLDCYVKTEYNGEPTPMKFVEVSASVEINYYSEFLLENLDRKDEIIEDFTIISELRGWLWEKYFCGGDNDPDEYSNVIKQLQALLQGIAEKYDLYYVED